MQSLVDINEKKEKNSINKVISLLYSRSVLFHINHNIDVISGLGKWTKCQLSKIYDYIILTSYIV